MPRRTGDNGEVTAAPEVAAVASPIPQGAGPGRVARPGGHGPQERSSRPGGSEQALRGLLKLSSEVPASQVAAAAVERIRSLERELTQQRRII